MWGIGHTGLCFREVDERHIILALQLCQERVLLVIQARVALERVAAQGTSGAEGLGRDDVLPALQVRYDGVANLRERVPARCHIPLATNTVPGSVLAVSPHRAP